MSTQNDVDPATLAPNKSYELSGKIMLSAIVILFGVVIFMVLLHLYARWYLLRARRRQLQRRNRTRRQNLVFYVDSSAPVAAPSTGLDPSVIKSLPVFEFKQEDEALDKVSECSVCLSEFEEGEKGRSLPKCGHCFHIECIDMWFGSHSTCPLCRASVEAVTVAEIVKLEEQSNLVVESSAADSAMVPSTSSFGVESKEFPIEIPPRIRTGSLETDESGSSFKCPGGRMMSFRRILSRGLSISSQHSTVDASSPGASACCDLEMGVKLEASREPAGC